MTGDDADDRTEEGRALEGLDGVGPETADRLREVGVESPANVAEASTAKLTAVEGVGESRAERLGAVAAADVGEVTVSVYEDDVDVGPYYGDDAATFARYAVVETEEETLVAGAPFDLDALDDRVGDDGIDHLVPLRTDEPRTSRAKGTAAETYLADAWMDLFEDVDTVYPPPVEGDGRVDEDGPASRFVRVAEQIDSWDDVEAGDAPDMFWNQFERYTETLRVDPPDVGEPGPIPLSTGDGSVEVRPMSASCFAVRHETDGESRTVAVDFARPGQKTRDTYEEAFDAALSDDVDAFVTTTLSGREVSQFDGSVSTLGLFEDGSGADRVDAEVFGPKDVGVDRDADEDRQGDPLQFVLGPDCVAAGTGLADRAATLLDELGTGPAADGGERPGSSLVDEVAPGRDSTPDDPDRSPDGHGEG